jgi:hypothetical protein
VRRVVVVHEGESVMRVQPAVAGAGSTAPGVGWLRSRR